jgi:hypothetical protein
MNRIKLYFQKVARAKRFKAIRKQKAAILAEKVKRIEDARAYMNEWQDIPMSQLYGPVCKILHIDPNLRAAREFCMTILYNHDDETHAMRLP